MRRAAVLLVGVAGFSIPSLTGTVSVCGCGAGGGGPAAFAAAPDQGNNNTSAISNNINNLVSGNNDAQSALNTYQDALDNAVVANQKLAAIIALEQQNGANVDANGVQGAGDESLQELLKDLATTAINPRESVLKELLQQIALTESTGGIQTPDFYVALANANKANADLQNAYVTYVNSIRSWTHNA
jgi:hypothetical protein